MGCSKQNTKILPRQVSVEGFEALKVFRLEPCHARRRLLKVCHAPALGARVAQLGDLAPSAGSRRPGAAARPGLACARVVLQFSLALQHKRLQVVTGIRLAKPPEPFSSSLRGATVPFGGRGSTRVPIEQGF